MQNLKNLTATVQQQKQKDKFSPQKRQTDQKLAYLIIVKSHGL